MTAKDFENVLAEQGRDFNDVKKQIKQGMGYDEYFEALVAKEIGKPTDEEIKEYYEKNQQQFSQPEMVQSSHILFDTRTAPEGTDPNTYKADQHTKAKEVLAEIKAGGDFAELAEKYSSCPSKSRGGDLGKNPRGRMVPEFDKATFEDIKPGNVGDEIVETQFGYHIIKVGEKTEAKTQTFDEVKDQIAEQLLNVKKQEFARKHIDKLKQDAKIEYPMDVKPADANAAN
jgi:peptidyl-prolyl cis-trans isomerase C